MALKFEIGEEAYADLPEGIKDEYEQHGEGYRLKVDGIDPADELKEALRKEREERAEAKRKLQEYEERQSEAERKSLEERQEFEKLYKAESETKTKLEQELVELRRGIAEEKRNHAAMEAVSGLASDSMRSKMLYKEALQFVAYTPEGVKINGPDGESWDASRLSAYMKENYPFLVDGTKASGGGASGGQGSGAATGKRFDQLSGSELSQLRAESPSEYDRLKSEYYSNS